MPLILVRRRKHPILRMFGIVIASTVIILVAAFLVIEIEAASEVPDCGHTNRLECGE